MTDSPRYHFSKQDFISIGWLVFHASLATAVVTLSDALLHMDFGVLTPGVWVGIAALSKTVQQWVAGPSCAPAPTPAPEVVPAG